MFLPGDNSKKFSFLIGFGNNYPQKPHHRSSSCPSTGSCGWNDYNSANPNPQVSWFLIILPKSGLDFIWLQHSKSSFDLHDFGIIWESNDLLSLLYITTID